MMFNKLIDYIADRVIQRIDERKYKEEIIRDKAVGRRKQGRAIGKYADGKIEII